MEQNAEARGHSFSTALVALLMIGYPIYSVTHLRTFDLFSPRVFLLIALECLGVAAAVGALLRKYWRVLLAASSAFLLTLFGPPAATGFDFSFYAMLAVGLLFFLSRNPPIAEALPLGRPRPTSQYTNDTAGGAIMSEEEGDLEVLKYRLEREKFEWQKTSREAENTIISRNFGVIITAIVSIAAIVVSLVQLSISTNNAKAQIDNDKLKNDRQFYFEIAKFLLDRRQELTTRDNERVVYLRNVVISSFPPDVALQIASSMKETATTNDARRIWEDGLTQIRTIQSRSATK